MKKISDILIVKPSSLGDIFHTFPAVELLQRKYPEAKFDWLVNPVFADAIDFSPVPIRRKIMFPRHELSHFSTFTGSFLKLWQELRQEKYDLVVDFQGLFRSAFFGWLARGHNQIGYANPKEASAKLFYHHRFQPDIQCRHAIERNYDLAAQITGMTDPLPPLSLNGATKFKEPVDRILTDLHITANDKLIAVTPGARWESKCFPVDFFAAVIKKFNQRYQGCRFLVLGSKSECNDAARLISLLPDCQMINLTGKTSIGEFAELICRCRAIVSNDSGPIHIAAAARIPVFAFFGPTDPELTGPYGLQNHIFQADTDCLKCLERKCPQQSNACHNLNPEKVAEALTHCLEEVAP